MKRPREARAPAETSQGKPPAGRRSRTEEKKGRREKKKEITISMLTMGKRSATIEWDDGKAMFTLNPSNEEVTCTRLKYTFELMELDDRKVAVPVGDGARDFRGVVKLNESAAEIFELLEHETTEDEVIAKLMKKYGNDPSIVEYVHQAVEYFRSEGVLE